MARKVKEWEKKVEHLKAQGETRRVGWAEC